MSSLRRVLRAGGIGPAQLILPAAAGSITLIAALSLTLVSGWLITRAWQMPPVLFLGVAVTSVRALGISRAVFRYLDRLASHKLALGALARLRAAVYDSLSTTTRQVEQAISRDAGHIHLVADAERISDYIPRSLIPRLVAVVVSAFALLITVILSPLSGLVMLAAFLITGIVVPAIAARLALTYDQQMQAQDHYLSALDAVLYNRVEYAVHGRSDVLQAQAEEASKAESIATVRAQAPLAVASGLQSLATGLAALGVLAVATATYQGNPMWLGVLVLGPLAAFESHGPLPAAALAAAHAQRSAHRLEKLLDAPQLVRRSGANDEAHARALRTEYGDMVWDFDVLAGQRMVVRAPSGAGKTMLLETLAGLRAPRAGEVSIPREALLFSEDAWVFATSVRENLRVAAPTASDALM